MASLKEGLQLRLREARLVVLARVEGLSEYDLRRPMTPTGTNLLGLVKHLAGEEYGYLGEAFGRPPKQRPSWFRDDPATEIDMWASPDESSGYILKVYRDAAIHADETIAQLDLRSEGLIPSLARGPAGDHAGIDARVDGGGDSPARRARGHPSRTGGRRERRCQ